MGAQFEPADIAVLVVYFLAVMATGLYAMCSSKRDTTAGYFLAGRFVTLIPIGASLFASNIGSEHFIGLAGSGAAAGLGVGAYELNAIFLLQLLGWIFLPVYLASGVFTLPEYIRKRYGGRRIQVYLSVLSLALYILTKVSVNLYAGSLFINSALHWDFVPSILLIIGLTAFCTISGGLAAVIYTDTIQAFLMCSGGVVLMIFAFIEVGGISELFRKYMTVVPADMPPNSTCGMARNDSLVMMRAPVGSDTPWPGFIFGQTTASIWYWCADQVIVQRALAAKNLSHAQGGTFFAGYLKILPLFMMVMPGMISRVLFTDEIACSTPEVCQKVCGNKAGCSNLAYPKLILNLMPTGLRGLMVAVMLAALVTDLTSIFNSASSLFTIDIYPLARKNPSNREQMIVGRVFVIVMTLVAIFWVPVVQSTQGGQLFLYIQAVTAYLAPPIAAVFLVSVLWPRATEKGAFWALMTSLVTGGTRMVLDFVYPEPACGVIDTRPGIVGQVHFMYFALLLFGQTTIVMIAISLMTSQSDSWRLIRTIYWNRFDATPRNDEYPEAIEKYKSKISTKISPVERRISIPGLENPENLHKVSKTEELGVVYNQSDDDVSVISTGKVVDDDQPQTFLKRIGFPRRSDSSGNPKGCKTMSRDWLKFLASWFCGFDFDGQLKDKDKTNAELMETIEAMNSERQVARYIRKHENLVEEECRAKVEAIRQSSKIRLILFINLIIIVTLDVFLYIFFSIPPQHNGIL